MDDYAEYLQARFQGEVFGEALFAGLAHRSVDEAARAKWRCLEQLEKRTKDRIRTALEELGLPTKEDPARRSEGEDLAERLSLVPWERLMKGMRREFERYVEEFRAAEALAPPGEAKLAQYITEHERALLEFADRELRGAGDDPLEPIRRLRD